MTLTGLAALELRDALRRGRGRIDSLAFQRRHAKLAASSWALTTGEDLRWPATQGGKITPKVKLMHWYIEQVMRLIPKSEDVFRRFQQVNHMLKSPAALFHPAVLGPVLRQALAPRPRAVSLAEAQERASRQSATTSAVAVRH